jgi:hypothetical protein
MATNFNFDKNYSNNNAEQEEEAEGTQGEEEEDSNNISLDVSLIDPYSMELEELISTMNHMKLIIQSKDNHLQMAGEIGSNLLEKNELFSAQIEEFTNKLHEAESQSMHSLGEQRQLERKLVRLQAELAEADNRIKYQSNEIEEYKLNLLNEKKLTSQLSSQQPNNENIHEEQQNIINSLQNKIISLNAELVKANNRVVELSSSLDNVQHDLHYNEEEVQRLSSLERKFQSAMKELEQLKNSTQTNSNDYQQIQWENERLSETCRELTQHIQQLNEESQQDHRQFNALKLKLQQLESSGSSTTSNNKFASLADDLGVIEEERSNEPPVNLTINTRKGSITSSKPVKRGSIQSSAALTSPPPPPIAPTKPVDHTALDAILAQQANSISPNHNNQSANQLQQQLPELNLRSSIVNRLIPANSNAKNISIHNTVASKSMPTQSLAAAKIKNSTAQSSSAASTVGAATLGFSNFFSNVWNKENNNVSNAAGTAPAPPAAVPLLAPHQSNDLLNPLTFQSTTQHPLNTTIANIPNETLSTNPIAARDADLEFFSLTLLSCKINSGKKFESLYFMSTSELRAKAKREGIQFHQYHRWIENELTKAYIQSLYNKNKSQAPRSNVALPTAKPVSSTTANKLSKIISSAEERRNKLFGFMMGKQKEKQQSAASNNNSTAKISNDNHLNSPPAVQARVKNNVSVDLSATITAALSNPTASLHANSSDKSSQPHDLALFDPLHS